MNQQMIRKMQQMQKDIQTTQKEIEETAFTSTSGPVTIVMYGTKELKNVTIAPDFKIEDSTDLEMLGDLVVAACRQATKEIDIYTNEKMEKYKAFLGGMGGMF